VRAAAAEFVGNCRKLAHLPGGDHSAGDLGADHVDAGLPLTVDAAAQPNSAKLIIGETAGHERFGLFPEQFDIAPDS
jgi:hypothetical protein